MEPIDSDNLLQMIKTDNPQFNKARSGMRAASFPGAQLRADKRGARVAG